MSNRELVIDMRGFNDNAENPLGWNLVELAMIQVEENCDEGTVNVSIYFAIEGGGGLWETFPISKKIEGFDPKGIKKLIRCVMGDNLEDVNVYDLLHKEVQIFILESELDGKTDRFISGFKPKHK